MTVFVNRIDHFIFRQYTGDVDEEERLAETVFAQADGRMAGVESHVVARELPESLRVSVERIKENCEPALCTVLFMGGAGGSLRAGVTENPVRLTRSIKDALTYVSCGGAPVYIWPGGGITFMVDVTRVPENAFGYVPTPALVAPVEFTMRLADYAALGGHLEDVRPLASLGASPGYVTGRAEVRPHVENPWPLLPGLPRSPT